MREGINDASAFLDCEVLPNLTDLDMLSMLLT